MTKKHSSWRTALGVGVLAAAPGCSQLRPSGPPPGWKPINLAETPWLGPGGVEQFLPHPNDERDLQQYIRWRNAPPVLSGEEYKKHLPPLLNQAFKVANDYYRAGQSQRHGDLAAAENYKKSARAATSELCTMLNAVDPDIIRAFHFNLWTVEQTLLNEPMSNPAVRRLMLNIDAGEMLDASLPPRDLNRKWAEMLKKNPDREAGQIAWDMRVFDPVISQLMAEQKDYRSLAYGIHFPPQSQKAR